jgi:CO/xanthine dehydrogenase FAD-binding subunit
MITRYHRPATLDEAASLLERPGAFVMAGGTSLNGDPASSGSDAVDIQALELSGIDAEGDSLRIGSTTILQDIVTSPLIPQTLSELARREAPNTIRNAATVGGVIGINDPESELLAGFMAFDARISLTRGASTSHHALEEILNDPALLEGAIITRVAIDSGGTASAHRTGRTPMDRPIVMVVGRRDTDGNIRLAMTGVDFRVVAFASDQIPDLDPPADFRGSSEYRRRLASILTDRVLEDLGGGGAE